MSKTGLVVVRVCGWAFLVLTLLSLTGQDRPDNLVDKASIYMVFFLAHFGVLARFQTRQDRTSPGFGKALAWSVAGIFGGLVGGYILWNGLQFVAVALHGGRFDASASWGVLVLAVGLWYWISATPYREAEATR